MISGEHRHVMLMEDVTLLRLFAQVQISFGIFAKIKKDRSAPAWAKVF